MFLKLTNERTEILFGSQAKNMSQLMSYSTWCPDVGDPYTVGHISCWSEINLVNFINIDRGDETFVHGSFYCWIHFSDDIITQCSCI